MSPPLAALLCNPPCCTIRHSALPDRQPSQWFNPGRRFFQSDYLESGSQKISLNPHEEFWWRKAGRLLGALMSDAGYSSQRQHQVLHFFASAIAPFLGAARGTGSREWESFMTDDHHPIEFSWDWHTGKEAPTIRFVIEPVSVDAGTPQDPDNQYADQKFRQVLVDSLPEMDKEWFHHFCTALVPDSPVSGATEGHQSRVFYGFDFGTEMITPKLYLFPGFVAQTTNQTNIEVITKAICTAPHCRNTVENIPGLSIFSSFVNDPSTPPLELDMLAVDLVRPLSSRLKIYFRSRETSFRSVRQAMSLGGRVNDSVSEVGLENLRKIFDLLLGTDGLPETGPLRQNSHRTAGLIYNAEFRLDGEAPKVKIYIPVRHYAANDGKILEALEKYMYGTGGQAQSDNIPSCLSYERSLRELFKPSDVQEETGLHTYVACSIQQGGDLRVVSYINGQTDKFQH